MQKTVLPLHAHPTPADVQQLQESVPSSVHLSLTKTVARPCGTSQDLAENMGNWKGTILVCWLTPPPPPCPGTTLRKNQPLVPRSNSRITFFTRVVGFSCFWWM